MGSNQSTHITTSYKDGIKDQIIECKYDWTIDNIENLPHKTGTCITSQRCKTDINGISDEWEIVLYLGGFNDRTAGFLSVWLRRISTNERLVKFTCQILSTKNKFITKTIKKKLCLESVLGWSVFCKRSHVLNEGDKIPSDNILVLKCNLQVYDDKYILHPTIEDEDPYMDSTVTELSENLNELMNKKGDVTFEVEGELFSAHKSILGSRSAVFRAMFDFELYTGKQKIFIADTSKEAFEAMLRFIYTGKHCEAGLETSLELYYAADKYELLSLRRMCSKILAHGLNTENVVTVIALANKHSDLVLQDIAVLYIAKNAAVVQKRKDWLDLMTSFPTLANAVFECLAQLSDAKK